MSETGPSPSPEAEPTKDPEHVEGIPDALQIDMIDALRDKELKRINELVHDPAIQLEMDGQQKAREKAIGEFDAMIERHLLEKGVDKDDPKFGEYKALLRDYSVDHIPENIWKDGKLDDKGEVKIPPMRKAARAAVDSKYGSSKTEEKKEDDPAKTETDEEKAKREEAEAKEKASTGRQEKIDELKKELEGLGDVKHKAFAARMAVSFFKRGKKRQEINDAYETAEKEYLETLEELHKMLIEDKLKELEGKSDVEKNKATSEYLEKEFSGILEADNEAQKKAMLAEGGFKAKILEKYAGASPKTRVALAIGGAAVLGTATVLTAGLAGVFAGIGAAGAIGGAKYAKTHMVVMSRIYANKSPDRLEFKVDDFGNVPYDVALQSALDRLKNESKEDIKNADKLKRNAVVLGALAAGGAGLLVNGAIDAAGNWGLVGDIFSSDVEAKPSIRPEQSWVINNPAPIEVPKPVMEFTGATDMRAGAGGYEQIRKAFPGISTEQMRELWDKSITDLQGVPNGLGRPLVYQMENGGYGLRMTADHQMPPDALKALAKNYQELYGTNPPGVKVTEVVTATGPNNPIPVNIDKPVVTPTDVETMKSVILRDTIRMEDITGNAALFEKISTVAPNLSGDNFARALGLPGPVWDDLEKYLGTRVNDLGYQGVISQGPNGIVFRGGHINPDIMADMLNHIPPGVRASLRTG